MRNYIFEFDQEVVLRIGLKLNELLFLDYVAKFINSGNMRYKYLSGKRYYRLTYKKILEDLPVLKIKERQLRNLIASLEEKGVLERYAELKNEMHLYVDFNVLFGKKLPAKFNLSEIGFHNEGNGLLTIDYYDIKKIKIIHDNARVKELDINEFLNNLLANLKIHYGEILYDGFIKDKLDIDEITSKEIIFDIGNVKLVGQTYAQRFKDAFDNTLKAFLG